MPKGRRFCQARSDTRLPSLEHADSYPQLAVVDDGLFIVFLDIVREIVDRDIIVFNILHDLRQDESIPRFRFCGRDETAHTLLESLELTGSERVGFSNNGDDIDTRRETTHEFDINFAKTGYKSVSRPSPSTETLDFTYA